MPDIDALSLADQAVLLGLVTRAQAREAVSDAEDGTLDAVVRTFLRKGLLTSWQVEKLKKGGDPSGFFFGGCKVMFHLAEGTFARVYRGVKIDTGGPVAIKVLRQRFVSDSASIDRFKKEAEAGMKLAHPNIVRILDYGEEDTRSYMIMEYVEGANLRDFLRIRSRLDQEAALPLMIGMARGLKYSLDKGVTHRDIKGTNILISNNGEAKLVDFGLATIEGEAEKEKKGGMTSQRTVDYSALERTCGSEKGDPRSDIFFLGCVYYQMLTGKAAMPESESKDMLSKMLKRGLNSIVPLSEHPNAPDPELTRVVEKMMKVELKSRYQSMDDVIADLERFEKRLKSGITGIEEAGGEDEADFLGDIQDLFVSNPGAAGTAEKPLGAPAAASESTGSRRKNLLCVESQTDIQNAFRKTLSRMGYRVILVGDPEVAAERYRESPFDAVIFDVDGLGAESIEALVDMHDKAREDGHDLAALVLLGPKQEALREKLPNDDSLIVLAKPVKMKQVQHAINRLMPSR
jgi:tRNA A-37 threonylcarbamoyl transferase component Bud32